MFELTPFERKNSDLFQAFHDFEKSFFSDMGFGAGEFKTDIKDKGDKFILEAELPGFEKEDIKVDIHDHDLTISAERKNESEDKDKDGNYIRRERTYGCFQRSFHIPNVKTEEIDGSYKHGVLKLTLPKKETAQPSSRRIELN